MWKQLTLRRIARWKNLIVTDLTSAFYQIPLAKESMKYCGVATPFRGVRACRSSNGHARPGFETALKELMCRVLGDCLQDGIAAKLADDLFKTLKNAAQNALKEPKSITLSRQSDQLWMWLMGQWLTGPSRGKIGKVYFDPGPFEILSSTCISKRK